MDTDDRRSQPDLHPFPSLRNMRDKCSRLSGYREAIALIVAKFRVTHKFFRSLLRLSILLIKTQGSRNNLFRAIHKFGWRLQDEEDKIKRSKTDKYKETQTSV